MTPDANIEADLLPLFMEEFDEEFDEDEDEDEDDLLDLMAEARVYEYELTHVYRQPEEYFSFGELYTDEEYNYYIQELDTDEEYNYYIQELDTDNEDEPLDNEFHFSFWGFLLMLFRAIFQ